VRFARICDLADKFLSRFTMIFAVIRGKTLYLKGLTANSIKRLIEKGKVYILSKAVER
jgi:hypothetical protein